MEITGRLEEDCSLAMESRHSVDAAVAFPLDGDGIAENVQDVDVLVAEEGGDEGRGIVVDDRGEKISFQFQLNSFNRFRSNFN